jgi:pyruvate dehydrogenase E1 component alpha subunit
MEPSREKLVWMYKTMVQIRSFELRVMDLYARDRLPGFLHPVVGQEAVPVGACANLREDDYIVSTHRGHGDVIAKGADLDLMMAELFGRKTGYCRGKGGSMHIASFALGILGANGIVGGGIPIANGAGVSAQLRGTDQVTVCFFGDGASSQGGFHESLNLASVWELPVIFVCSNNLYADTTPIRMQTKVDKISRRAQGYAMPGFSVDGNDVLEVYEVVGQAVERARQGGGPTLIECLTYRWFGHSCHDPAVYRTKEEVAEWKKKDPVARFKAVLLEKGMVTEQECQQVDSECEAAIDSAIEFATNSPKPDITEAVQDVYATTEVVE